MPKLAATLASFLLIASSIGVNIARYPQVGRTMDAAAAGAAETASPLQNAGDIPHVEKADADQSPVGQEKAPPAVTEKRQTLPMASRPPIAWRLRPRSKRRRQSKRTCRSSTCGRWYR